MIVFLYIEDSDIHVLTWQTWERYVVSEACIDVTDSCVLVHPIEVVEASKRRVDSKDYRYDAI